LYMVEEFTILGLGKIYDYQKKYTIIHTFLFIAVMLLVLLCCEI